MSMVDKPQLEYSDWMVASRTLERRRRRGGSLGEGIEVAAYRGGLFKGGIE